MRYRGAARLAMLGVAAAVVITVIVTAGASLKTAADSTTIATVLPPTKQALEDAAASYRATAPKADKAADPGRPVDTQTDGPPETGLLGAFNAPISGTEFTPENAWAGWINAKTYVQVWAGYSPEAPDIGLVFIVRRSGSNGRLDDGEPPAGSLVNAPKGDGPLEIVRAVGTKLIMADAQGRQAQFDTASSVFDNQ